MHKDIIINFGDINHDGFKGAIACLSPIQCDGWNGGMKFQFTVLLSPYHTIIIFLKNPLLLILEWEDGSTIFKAFLMIKSMQHILNT